MANRSIRLAVLPGDGIGPEVTAATVDVVAAAAERFELDLELVHVPVGLDALAATGSTLPDEAFAQAKWCDGIILGPVSHHAYPSRGDGGLNPSGDLRKRLDLYANIRPARTRAGISPRTGVPLDLVIVRENTEGFYADRNMTDGSGEILVTDGVAISLRRITRGASDRIVERAFEIAAQRSGRVTAVHKANVLRTTCGLFLESCRRQAAANPDIEYDEELVDAMCAHLVRSPDRFDVIVTTNMFGDILSDLASELSGSLGLAASLNAGDDHAVAQAQHGSAPDIAGRGSANPAALIGSAAMLLDWLAPRHDPALAAVAAAIDTALDAALSDPANRTPDLGGSASTEDFTTAVVAALG